MGARCRAWPRALDVNQRSHEGSSGPVDGVAGSRQGTHLEKRVRFSGPGSRGAPSALLGGDRRPRPRPGRAPPGCEDAARASTGAARARGDPAAAVARPRRRAGSGSATRSCTSGSRATSSPPPRRTRRCASTSPAALDHLAALLEERGVAVTRPDPGEIPGAKRSSSPTRGATGSSWSPDDEFAPGGEESARIGCGESTSPSTTKEER